MTSTQKEPDARAMLTIRIAGDVSVCVPRDINLMSPYVLLEQEDWFEDDIRFVRKLLGKGESVIDIGANYGVYALSMAQAVGESGKVWAIDPSTATMDHLECSIARNQFRNITLIRAGLSDQVGRAYLPRETNPELGAVVVETTQGKVCDEIELLTLDECEQRYGWRDIRFIKMDAEGHENRILQGGSRFLAVHSPLIMYEIKAGNEFNRSLIGDFAALGYQSYRLLPVPGGEMLVPLAGVDEVFDPYILNLYCCKPDCADELSARGLLCLGPVQAAPALTQADHWLAVMAGEPHAQSFRKTWDQSAEQRESQQGWIVHREALNHYALSRNIGQEACLRAAHLKKAFDLLAGIVSSEANLARLISLARVATEYGRRSVAVNILQQLMSLLERQTLPVADEPFLAPPGKATDIGGDLMQWQAHAISESYVRLGAYSDYFRGDGNLPLLDALRDLGRMSPEMERRRQLIRMRGGLQSKPEYCQSLAKRGMDNLNPEYWAGRL